MSKKPHRKALPRERMTLPRERMTLPRERITLPRERITLPRERMTLPHERMTLPRERMTLPRERMTLPRERITLPRERMTLPRERKAPKPSPKVPKENPKRKSQGDTGLQPRVGRWGQRGTGLSWVPTARDDKPCKGFGLWSRRSPLPHPLQGWGITNRQTQGSSCLATLGWRTQLRWSWCAHPAWDASKAPHLRALPFRIDPRGLFRNGRHHANKLQTENNERKFR